MKKKLGIIFISIGIILSFNSIAKSDYCVDQNFLYLYDEQNYCNPKEILSWMPKVYKIDLKTWEEMKNVGKKISKELGQENVDKFFDKVSVAREKIYKDYIGQSIVSKKEPIKNLNSIELSENSDVSEAWKAWLNQPYLDELTKSIVKINFDQIVKINSTGGLVPFRENLEFLFGKSKKYIDKNLYKKSQKKIGEIFVTKKNELEKYPYKTILGMAYFEFFYAGQLEDTRKRIQKFIKNRKNQPVSRGELLRIWQDGEVCAGSGHDACSKFSVKEILSIYSLNEVRKKMRQSIGFSLDDEPSEVIKYYITLSKYLKNSKPQKQKINSKDKKIIKLVQSFNKYLSMYEKNLKTRQASHKKLNDPNNYLLTFDASYYKSRYERVIKEADKKFYKKLNKNHKKLIKINSKINSLKDKNNEIKFETERLKFLYITITEIVSDTNRRLKYKTIDHDTALDSICLANKILKMTKSKTIKSKYNQIWPLDFEIKNALDKEENIQMQKLSHNKKIQEFIENKKFQSCVINLIDNNYPVKEILTNIEKKFDIKNTFIKMNYASIDEMKVWKKSDWANSWNGSFPSELKDKNGNLIDFSKANIEDIRAQLALNNFNSILDNNEINNIDIETQDIQNSIQDIKNTNISALLNQDFSITLDNYSRILAEDAINRFGDQFDAQTIQEIRDNANFENLTAITNMEYGTNMTSSEYKSYWENAQYMDSTSTWGDVTRGVDLISNLSSFDAAAAAKELGADLQTVADSIAQAASVGISTDLEAAAQGLGYNSFSDAVNAYNAEHGTNYTEEEAKEALGQ